MDRRDFICEISQWLRVNENKVLGKNEAQARYLLEEAYDELLKYYNFGYKIISKNK